MDDPIGSQLLVQLLLICINAFFAATETAVVTLNENKIRKKAEDGDAKAILMLKMVESPTRFLSTIQVCITLSGFMASAFAASSFASVLANNLWNAGLTFVPLNTLNTLCVMVITLILSYFMIVLGELVPKRIALQDPEKIARFSCGVIEFVAKLFKPLVWLLTISTNGVLRLFRINPNAQSDEVTEEEIRMMVDIGSESGAIEQDERAMIENIFEFNNTTAADVMIHRMDVVALHVDDSNAEIVQTIRESGLSRFPVYDADIDDIIGVLNTRDFLLNTQSEQPKAMRELLRSAYLVPETVPADTLFNNMQKQKIHLAVVVDEYGGMSGIVTMEDLLEEIVGNIYDEFDPKEDIEIEKMGDNLWRVMGTVDLDTLADELAIDLPLEEEYDTLSGMVFSTLSSIPEDGSTPEVTMHGLHIQVESICDHRVEKALVSKVLPVPAPNAEGLEKSDSKKSDGKPAKQDHASVEHSAE
ncbi:MAG: hemolysin family protein [Clostridia bacterium]